MKVGYARVSTRDQDPSLQTDALRQAGCDRIYEDRASGAQRDRPQLREALDYMRQGDVLVVWRLDRLARSMRQLITTVGDLEERGIEFQSLTESIDTTTPGGKLVFHVFGAVAEFERSIMQERTRAGLDAARQRGRTGGRPPALSEEQAGLALTLMLHTDTSVRAIAKQLGVSPATLYRHFPGGRAALRDHAAD
ncbi:recombinase family protein [Thioalkalivibrio sp. ALMg11]|uniref:recombinase family protein n=1 Tax=Thioalkalivibrio sp. ALMg11 TaxID=1158165 RepID=UPI000371AAFE|nr:recombinase family protein [Thioalkalivibrio sp. ALMg11]